MPPSNFLEDLATSAAEHIFEEMKMANAFDERLLHNLEVTEEALLGKVLGKGVCSCEEIETVTKVKQKLKLVLYLADEMKLDNFKEGLQKWLSGNDSERRLSTEWLKQVELITDAENFNELRLLKLEIMRGEKKGESLIKVIRRVMKDGERGYFKDSWDEAKRYPIAVPFSDNTATVDFVLTVGSFQITSEGEFRVTYVNNEVSLNGEVTHRLTQKIREVKQPYDMFDFEEDRSYPPEWVILLGGALGITIPSIKFNELNLLKKCDGAADYPQSASWNRVLNMSGPNLPDELDKLSLEDPPSPSPFIDKT
jgi:hypothetical protein